MADKNRFEEEEVGYCSDASRSDELEDTRSDHVNDHAVPPPQDEVEVIFPEEIILEKKETCDSRCEMEQHENEKKECIDHIGGFENKMRLCMADSYLNRAGATWCEFCGAALVANPCPDMDHQIALHLKRKEERDAFMELQKNERKCRNMHKLPLFEQAQTIVSELTTHVEFHFPHMGIRRSPTTTTPALRCRRFGKNQKSAISLLKAHGYWLVSEADLYFSMARFLTCIRQQNGCHIQLGFMFGSRYEDMRLVAQGERYRVKVILAANNEEAVADAFCRWNSVDQSEEPPPQSTQSHHSKKPQFRSLNRISEDSELKVDDVEISAVGWIVAMHCQGRKHTSKEDYENSFLTTTENWSSFLL